MSTSDYSSALPNVSLCDSPEPDIRALQTIIDDQIYVIRQFLSPSVCQGFVKHLDTQDWGFTNDIRVGGVCRFHNAEDGRRLWKETRLDKIAMANDKIAKDVLLGVSPNIRIYRYLPGQFFGPHCQSCFPLIHDKPNRIKMTEWKS